MVPQVAPASRNRVHKPLFSPMNPQTNEESQHDEAHVSTNQAPVPRAEPPSLEAAVFGAYWQQRTCTFSEAKAYFKARFGLGHTSFYEILRPHLKVRSLAPEHLYSKMSAGGVLFIDEVVAACDELEKTARGNSREYYR